MSKEKEKPMTIILKITMPTKEAIASAIQKVFPLSNLYDIKVDIIEEEKLKTPMGVATPTENVTGYEVPIHPPGTVFECPTKKPEEAPPVKPEG